MWWTIAEWTGAVGALAGTFIVAARVPWGGWGFVVMAAFSAVLLIAAVALERWPYALLFLGYELANGLGTYRWLVASETGLKTASNAAPEASKSRAMTGLKPSDSRTQTK